MAGEGLISRSHHAVLEPPPVSHDNPCTPCVEWRDQRAVSSLIPSRSIDLLNVWLVEDSHDVNLGP